MVNSGVRARNTRPGLVIKGILSSQIPLIHPDGLEEFVSLACVTDMHRTYKAMLSLEMEPRPVSQRKRGMSYHSFTTLVRFARYLGYVEIVEMEAMARDGDGSGAGAGLLTIQDGVAVPSTRNYYGLTAAGEAEDGDWYRLSSAYRESIGTI